jgi:hypothetical protein
MMPLSIESDLSLASEDLHHQFRSIITPLALVTNFNNQGCSLLPEGSQVIYRSPLDLRMQPADTISLNALAAILVRDTDIVAAAATYSVSEAGDIEVIAVEESPPAGCVAGMTTTNDTYPDEPDFEDILFPKDTHLGLLPLSQIQGDQITFLDL